MPMVNVTSAEFEDKVINNNLPVLLDFGAVWCGPCKSLDPIVHQLADEYSGRLFVGHVDVGQAPDIAAKYGILGVPALLFLNNGSVVKQLAGVPSKSKLVSAIEDVLAEAGE
jgi:thioredoxin 1